MPEELTVKNEEVTDSWNPSDDQKNRVKFVYTERDDMVKKRDDTYPQFNDRTLKDFIDDSEKRLNAYVLDRASQGKEDWQANFATRAYANKAKALLAATSRDIPGLKMSATTEDDKFDYTAGDLSEKIVRYSYQEGNPQEEIFFLGWSLIGKGTVTDYEGFGKQSFTKKKIKSFDLLTGDVDYDVQEVVSGGEPVSFEIPLMNLLVKNFYIRDVQQQPAIVWDSYYADKDSFKADWGKYLNANFVKAGEGLNESEHDTYFHNHWKEGLNKGKGYLVSRYMNKYRDVYRVVCNGVELYNGPMPWIDITRKGRGKKAYPIAKAIFEPFATGEFFYGNSMPNSAMGEGDVLNTLFNTSLDKQYRSMVPPLLIGMVNKDMLDLEDEVVAGDTKIYVEDISQVQQMEIKGVSDSDIKMIELISRGLDLTTLDPHQQGQAQKYVTARAAVSADERARELKGLFHMMLTSLWLQKVRLRLPNAILSYTRPQMVQIMGEDGIMQFKERFKTLNVENTELSNGEKGTLAIQFASNAENLEGIRPDIEAEEARHQSIGKPFEKIGVLYDYLDNFSFDVQILPDTLWQASQSLNMALILEKINTVSVMFPEYFANNKETFFKDLLKAYRDNPDKYALPETQSFEEQQAMQMAEEGGGKQSPNSQLVSDITGTDRNNRLSKIIEGKE